MKIFAIETSCDETGIALIEANPQNITSPIKIYANLVASQIKEHQAFGGVVPSIAKREHSKALLKLTKQAFSSATSAISSGEMQQVTISPSTEEKVKNILEREEDLAHELLSFVKNTPLPKIDYITVTSGPGLEPALWVGINFAQALGTLLNIPVMPANHMEGHIMAGRIENVSEDEITLSPVSYPLLSLLISGGHTELVLSNSPQSYKILGQTRDDASGEAFDKVARLLDLPYPGGPHLSKLATEATHKSNFDLPRPMKNTDDYDFSFSGLKTAVLYKIKNKALTKEEKTDMAFQFEEAVSDVLAAKTAKAIDEFNIQTLIVGGGVSANTRIRKDLTKLSQEKNIMLHLPSPKDATDNALMIAISTYIKIIEDKNFHPNKIPEKSNIQANGNLRITSQTPQSTNQ